ncbi:APC family permease [Natronobacterium texcoconense]|uniref:Amino acid/polyamine/organocation transporter, APC superfamily n=1 Tax=Natronobacterium texcoconense TaxID=1095778 RepID=A0A1H1IAH4_NATTX|nr:APC family permease [Natronobacterium texcoconense]SDR34356.1 amino acid/polyamine/organocation transporter, APC superfamily [Natronobacterium texcoconense]
MVATDEIDPIVGKKIGLLGAVALVVGNAISVTMFLLPAHLMADGVGPSIVPAVVFAALPMVFGVIVMIQLGAALPVAGGGYVYPSRLIGPFWGFSVPWVVVPTIWFGLVYTAHGFAEYARFFVDVPLELLIVAVLLAFVLLNLRGISIVTTVQFALVSIIVGGMLLFIVPGAFHVDFANYTPVFPEGYGPFVVATISLFIGMYGFNLAIDIGEELEDPERNVPRVLVYSMVVGMSLMIGIVVIAVGVMHWTELAGLEAGIAMVALEFLPWWASGFVALAAVVGGLTTVNTLIVTYSREIMRAARDDVFPAALAKLHPEHQSPNRAVLLLGVPPLVIVPFTPSPSLLAPGLGLVLLYAFFLLSVAAWRLPAMFPDRYRNAHVKLPRTALMLVAIGGGVSTVVFWLLLSSQLPWMGLLILGWIALGYPVFRYRLTQFERRGIDLRERLRTLDDHEQITHSPDPGEQPDAVTSGE